MKKIITLILLVFTMFCPAYSAPAQSQLYYDTAVKQWKENKLYEANKTACMAIDVSPNSVKALKLRAQIRQALANYVGAIQDIDKAISIAPNDSSAYYIKGMTLYSMQNYPEAIENFNNAIRLNPNDYEAYRGRGFCKCLLGRIKIDKSYFTSALPDFEKSIKLHADNPDAYLYRGMAKAELNGANAGLKDIEYALSEYKRKGDMNSYNKYYEVYKWIKNEY